MSDYTKSFFHSSEFWRVKSLIPKLLHYVEVNEQGGPNSDNNTFSSKDQEHREEYFVGHRPVALESI
jgi:hypothetical protein